MRETVTGNLEVNRPSTPFAKYRAYPVFVDGEKVGSVKDGASTVLTLPTGSHEIWCKIDWEKSNVLILNINPGTTTKISVTYKKKLGLRFFLPAIASLLAVIVGATFGLQILTIIGVLGLVLTKIGDLHIDKS